jgi:hypothetical protein
MVSGPAPSLRQPRVRILSADQWSASVRQCTHVLERDHLIGVSITLAAKLLNVCRSRVHQLIGSQKLSLVSVYEGKRRIGHFVTLASIDHRRRTARPRRTQWRPQK